VKNRIRVAWVCTPLLYGIGGTWKHLTNWAASLDQNRFEAALFFGPVRADQAAPIREHFQRFRNLTVRAVEGLFPVRHWPIVGVKNLRSALEGWRPDIIHSIYIQSDFLGALARPASTRAHISSWESDPELWLTKGWKKPFYKLGFEICRKYIDHFVVLSSHLREAGIRDLHIPTSRISVIPIGLPAKEFPPRAYPELLLPLTTPRIGVISRLDPGKLVHMTVQAATQILKEFPDARFIIVGDGTERERLQRMAEELGIAGKMEFPGWRNDVPRLLAGMDVFVFTSTSEGLPVAVLEAQAAMVPTVSTRIGGVPDVITHGDNGLILEETTPKSIAESVLRLLRDPVLARSLAVHGRHKFERTYTIEHEMGALQDLYQRFCDTQGRR